MECESVIKVWMDLLCVALLIYEVDWQGESVIFDEKNSRAIVVVLLQNRRQNPISQEKSK